MSIFGKKIIEMSLDLRSDTLTKPTKAMLEAMFSAEVGDDVFGNDPTVNALETKVANMFGMEASLFCASGTMTNQIAVKVHTGSGTEVICDQLSHIYLYEGGGVAQNAHASLKLLQGNKGRLTAEMVKGGINNPDDIHQPLTRLVSLENTMNKGGGAIYDFVEIEKIKAVCVENNLALHLDGARLFNALVETKETPLQYGQVFDSISICLSKGLGCPVGSLILGSADFIKKCKRVRKSFGGGWRQAGYLAAAGIYALDHHVDRLKEDHQKAKLILDMLGNCNFVEELYPADTNIVIFELNESFQVAEFIQALAQKDVHVVHFGGKLIRMVTHLDIPFESLETLRTVLKSIEK
jgi:threonine aldolase